MTDVIVAEYQVQGIPPEVEHFVEPKGTVRFAIDFLGPRRTA